MTKPLMIGIAGGSGSGKSTVARNVAELLTTSSVVFIDMARQKPVRIPDRFRELLQ